MVDGFARNIKHTSEGIIGGRKMENMKSVIRLRMSAHDAHYGGKPCRRSKNAWFIRRCSYRTSYLK